ncbi:NAD(P)/FAD-dependent oxidoreductase [Brevundimonas intermedia]|uniref:NAD(P)/FAD-dependent oxidoreductase n=1 Tax=Brevundimonas intermedia TaxID=74315 RepID=UPI0032084817
MDDQIVIVGAGHSGGALAISLRELGFSGRITLVGEEKHAPYERPSLSKEFLVSAADPVFVAPNDHWDSHDIDLRLGVEATGLDRDARTLSLSDGTVLGYDRLVIATGGHARRLPGIDHPAVHLLRHIDDARALAKTMTRAKRAVVVGGGVIGLEVASTLRGKGLEVTVLEAGDRLLGRNLPADAAAWLAAAHARIGVDIRLGRRLTALAGDGPFILTLDDGSSVETDLVVAGVGIVPAVAFARAAGLAEDGGVPVGPDYRSPIDPRVFAIGDVALRAYDQGAPARMETWAHAQSSARAAARSLLDLEPEVEQAPWFWTDQCGHSVQIAGRPEKADQVLSRGEGVRLYLMDGVLTGVACLDQPRDFGAARRLIGKRLTPDAACDPAVDLRRAAA